MSARYEQGPLTSQKVYELETALSSPLASCAVPHAARELTSGRRDARPTGSPASTASSVFPASSVESIGTSSLPSPPSLSAYSPSLSSQPLLPAPHLPTTQPAVTPLTPSSLMPSASPHLTTPVHPQSAKPAATLAATMPQITAAVAPGPGPNGRLLPEHVRVVHEQLLEQVWRDLSRILSTSSSPTLALSNSHLFLILLATFSL